jgi:hypothetical protein
MKQTISISLILLFVLANLSFEKRTPSLSVDSTLQKDSLPGFVKGVFFDDYGIRYTISDTVWVQHPNTRYYVISSNLKEQYIIVRNANGNASEPDLYTRIDYMTFEGMEPYRWGFCLSNYSAKSEAEAINGFKADKQNPRKGCNGFPFSRMKKDE